MKDHRRGSVRRWLAAMVALAVCATTAVGAIEYAHDDAAISGQELHAFSEAGSNVTVVLGEFKLAFGQRILTGRDAVIWIDTRQLGSRPLHDVTVYIEGDAKVQEAGAVTTDNTMLVTLHTDGRIRALARVGQRDLSNLPLYRRAVEARQAPQAAEIEEKPPEAAETQPAAAEPNAEDLVAWAGTEGARDRATRPAGPTSRPAATTIAVTAKAPITATQARAAKPVATGAAAAVQRPARPTTAPAPAVVRPVNFSADRIHSKQIGEAAQRHQVTVLNGHAYLSQGDPDSTRFLELRSDAAVIFTRQAAAGEEAPVKEARSPLAVLPTRGQVNIEGVYLEGDVIISQGERTFRGPTAYYDFLTDRAIVRQPVFWTVQEQRNIPIYVRAEQARLLSAREAWFKEARVSSSEFYTPSYHVGASTAYLMDNAPYDERGERLGPPSWEGKLWNTTANVAGVPIFYWPYLKTDFTEGHTPLRRVQFGRNGDYGWGVETQWHLFRLLGLIPPEGFKGTLDLDWYERGWVSGADLNYSRPNYSGYDMFYGVLDRGREDDFGRHRKDIAAPGQRGRILMRHKQLLGEEWELQSELGYVCDRNFMEAYFPTEHFAGKEQETLLYLRQQRDNRAITGLLQYRLNRFDTQTESAPDVAFHWIGQPVLQDRLTLFSESRAGLKRWRPDKGISDPEIEDSDIFGRLDTRDEIDLPLHLGPLNLVSYATGRATWWGDKPPWGDEDWRPYGQVGQRINTHIWRLYNNASSSLWDVNRLKHVITPEATAFVSDDAGVHPDELFPMDPDIEQHLRRLGGAQLGVYQRLQTKRGPAGNQKTVDWMRLNLLAGFYDDGDDGRTSNGKSSWYRPEYSLGRNHLTGEYSWQISDATAFLANANYDTDRGILGQADAGLTVQRDPRLRYYLGWRALKDLDSSVGTFGFNYKLSRKYSVSFFEQYDFDFDGSTNQATSLSIIRQLPRWFVGLTLTYVRGRAEEDDIGIMFTIWPEGIPEVRLGGTRMSLLGRSDKN
jgi:hypothetical protein